MTGILSWVFLLRLSFLILQKFVRHMNKEKNTALKERIKKNYLPRHIAIIMDGNGRWAQKRGNKRIFGHKNSVAAVRDTVEAAAELGIEYLTLFAFSTENWRRPKSEITALMSLLVSTIQSEAKTLMENNIRLLSIGNIASLPEGVQEQLQKAVSLTAGNTGLTLVLALSYGARSEIISAIKKLVKDIEANKIMADDINNSIFEKYLDTAGFPEPELLIRTSGEYRISNFLLWQIAYTELYFTQTLWPDFRREHLYEALLSFQSRERRFGKTTDQIRENVKVIVNHR
jgi:undecaprenyl diphosphate synthase